MIPPTSINASNANCADTFKLDPKDALTPDPGKEDMYRVENNKFSFSPGQLSKLFNPKSLNAFCALGGLDGLETGLRTDRAAGLNSDEQELDGFVTFESVAPKGTPKYGTAGDTIPESNAEAAVAIPPSTDPNPTGAFADRRRVFLDNKLPPKKEKTLLQIAWQACNDNVLILLTIAAAISLALGLYQTFGVKHEDGEPSVEWIEGVAILAAIVIVVIVGTVNDWHMQRQFTRLNKKSNEKTVKVIRSGRSQEICIFDIMVGDLMHLETGDVIPVDGIFIQGNAVKCDESSATGESDLLRKTPAAEVSERLRTMEGEKLHKLDPFIISA